MSEQDNRTILLLGEENFAKIQQCRVAVIGLGGVGSYALEALVRCGIQHITIVDSDTVQESNINRQIPALHSTIGAYKTDVMEQRLRDINPDIDIRKFTMRYTEMSSNLILSEDLDCVIDAIDAMVDKIQLIKTCINRKLPIISSMGAANRMDPTQFTIADIKETSVCPVARRVRKELRSEGIQEGLTVVYSKEVPIKTINNGDSRLGSIAFVPSVAGLFLASAAVNKLLDLSE